jgi:MSHA pilin protein MshC
MDEDGFTLIELLMVVVILGVLAFVAISRMNTQEARVATAAEQAATDIRYAQELAMATRRLHGIAFSASQNRYWVYRTTDTPDSVVTHPLTREPFVVALNGGVWVDGDFTVAFEAIGAPTSSGAVTLNSGQKTISVTSNTGRVMVQ